MSTDFAALAFCLACLAAVVLAYAKDWPRKWFKVQLEDPPANHDPAHPELTAAEKLDARWGRLSEAQSREVHDAFHQQPHQIEKDPAWWEDMPPRKTGKVEPLPRWRFDDPKPRPIRRNGKAN